MISRDRLIKERKVTGYRLEMIEKVVWLIQMLNSISEDSYLKDRLALKGGTALNLFHFNLPRLSVDADLNYMGNFNKEIIKEERPEVEQRIKQIFERLGLNLARNARAHAGGKMIWEYTSALGNKGNVEVDLNFMYRIPLLPTEQKTSIQLAGQQVNSLKLLDFHELVSGKLSALLDRGVGRDFFDAHQIFQHPSLDIEKLRLCFVIYAAMSSKTNLVNLNVDTVEVDYKDLKDKLIPVLNENFLDGFSSINEWKDYLVSSVRRGLKQLLPLKENEQLFINTIRKEGVIQPELITDNVELANKIVSHPALLWAARKMVEA
jgi:predicted nucleotidyltransferase component of viral defense system